MTPTMRFLVLVCVSEAYKDKIKPVLDRLSGKYEQYAERVEKELNCDLQEILSYVYMGIIVVSDYMIFKEGDIIYPQIQIIRNKLTELLSA